MAIQSAIQFTNVAPDTVVTPPTGYFAWFQSDGSTATLSPGSPPTVVNTVYRIDSLRNLTAFVTGVVSVSNADGTLTISPTTGAVVASRAAITGDLSVPVASNVGTLATVNSNVGTFGSATQVSQITVNGKGLVTAVANVAIQITESQVTNLTTDLAAKVPTSRTLTATNPVQIDGTTSADLSANRTISVLNAGLTQAGIVSTGTQVFGGAKEFNAAVTLDKSIVGPYPRYSLVAAGADPTGVASSTAAWNTVVAAINAAPRGGSMYLDAGVYLIDFATATQFTGSNWSIVGADRGCAAIVPSAATNTTSNLLTLPNQAMVTIRDVSFIATTVRTAGAMISTNGCDDVIIDRFQMSGHFNGISVDGSSIKVKVQDGVFTTSSGTPNADIVINNGAAGDTYIGPYIVASHTGANRPVGISVIATGHYEVNYCNVTGCSTGMNVACNSTTIAFGFLNSTLFDSCTVNGCVLDASAAGTIKQLFFNNCWYSGTIAGTGAAGFLSKGTLGSINGVQFTQCRALNNQTHGFQHGFGTGFEWIGCHAKGNSQAANNTSSGLTVTVGSNVTGWGVIGGRYGGSDSSDATPTPGQKNGIDASAASGTDIRIIGADLRGNASGALSLSATPTRVTIQGNIGMVVAPPGTAPGQLFTTTAITKVTTPSVFFPANGSRAGTKVRISALVTCAATLNTAPGFVPALRFGVTDSSSDTAIVATPAYSSAGTAAVGAARYVWEFTILSATTAQGSLQVFNLNNAASGVLTAIQTWGAISTTALTIPTTTADNFLGLYFTSTVASVCTVRDVSYEVWQ